jgi:hypothetical protein
MSPAGRRFANIFANLVSNLFSKIDLPRGIAIKGEAVQWQLQSMTVRSSGLSQVLILYLLVVFFAGCWKILCVWRILLWRFPGNVSLYIQELEKVIQSVQKWTQLTFLLWAYMFPF